MRRDRTYTMALAGLAGLLVLGAFLPCAYVLRTSFAERQQVLHGLGPFLFSFLALLLLRYTAYLWFGYLEARESDGADDCGYLPPLTILVPAYNEGQVIQASIRSLLDLDYPRYEILVIDDGSSDETYLAASALAGDHGSCRVRVLSQRNGGKASALNRGIGTASTEFVLCMDGDSKLAKDTLRRAIRHFVDPAVGAVAGNVKVWNRNGLLTRLQALEYIQGLNMARRAQAFFRAVVIVPGPIGVFRRRAILEVGGYPRDTFAEDCDLTLGLLERGWRIRYEPRAIAFTEAPERLLDLVKQRYRWTRGVLQALRKRRRSLLRPEDPALGAAFLQLVFEGLVWPVINVGAHLLLIVAGVLHGMPVLLIVWWSQLTVLDVAAAFYCLAAEREDLRLLPYAFVYRVAFTLVFDMCKVLATAEELLAVEMEWGKLERAGRL
jgi:cellulose synthase/poly-beta-1,6-N-acetylglucosamine synthase-like glycosyltransferase